MSYDIGVRLGVDGEQAFRSSINAINANIKAMGTELKAVTAQFARNADSEDALAAKNQVLAKSITATKDKIGVLDKQLERQTEKLKSLGDALEVAASAHGKDSQEALAAQNAYNKQAAAVAKLQEQLNGARVIWAGPWVRCNCVQVGHIFPVVLSGGIGSAASPGPVGEALAGGHQHSGRSERQGRAWSFLTTRPCPPRKLPGGPDDWRRSPAPGQNLRPIVPALVAPWRPWALAVVP